MKSSNRKPLSSPECTRATMHHIHHRTTPTNQLQVSLQIWRHVQECPGAPGATQITVGPPDSHNGRQGATCAPPPPRQHTLAAVSAPAEEKRAPNWEERTQQSNWAHGCPTHGSETSPNRTHSNAQVDHEVRALQQSPNAAHAERAISKQAPPSLYEVPANSTRAGAALRAPGGAVTSQPHAGQSTSYRDLKSARVGQEWVRKRGTQERQQTGGGAT